MYLMRISWNQIRDNAIKFANLAAGIVVGKVGSATTSITEIIDYESSLNKQTSDKKIKSIDEILILSKKFKAKGKKKKTHKKK